MASSVASRDFILHPCEREFLQSYKYSANAVNRYIWLSAQGVVLDFNLLKEAWKHVITTHESTRFTYGRNDHGQWFRTSCSDIAAMLSAPYFFTIDLSSINNRKIEDATVMSITDTWQRQVLERVSRQQPLVVMGLIQLMNDRQMICIVMHHLVHDGWTYTRILLPDLLRAYIMQKKGMQVKLAPVTSRYSEYCCALIKHFNHLSQRGPNYWEQMKDKHVLRLTPDSEARGDGFWRRHTTIFPQASVDRLHVLAKEADATPQSVLTTAMLHLMGQATNQWQGYLKFLFHGRRLTTHQNISVSRTSGLFFCGSFEHVGVDPSDSLVTQIRGVCESLTAVPDTGVDFSLYASSPDGRKRAAKFLKAYIQLNYIPFAVKSDLDIAFQVVRPPSGSHNFNVMDIARFHGMPEPTPSGAIRVWIVATRIDGFQIIFEYNDAMFTQAKIEDFSRLYASILEEICCGVSVNPQQSSL